MNFRNPIPNASSSRMKPMVAPDTNGIVFLIPCVAPEATIIMFTGPGVIDIDSEKIHIGMIWDMANNPYHFLLLFVISL